MLHPQVGELVSIVYTPMDMKKKSADRFNRLSMREALLVNNYGLQGDRKAGHPSRQINIMSAESLASLQRDGFKVAPGQMGEQLVISGIEVDHLSVGTQIQLGMYAILEVTEVREPCQRLARVQGKPSKLAIGRIGVLAKVTQCGMIHIRDKVKMLQPEVAYV